MANVLVIDDNQGNRETYAEVLEAWRTSCPRLPVWEEAHERGYVDHLHQPGQAALVAVSTLGLTYLRNQRASGASRDAREALAHSASAAR